MRMHTQGKSGWQYLRTPKVWPCLGRLHGGSRKGVDDEQQWLMRWGSTLLFTARIAATSNQNSAPKISPGIWHLDSLTLFFESSTLF